MLQRNSNTGTKVSKTKNKTFSSTKQHQNKPNKTTNQELIKETVQKKTNSRKTIEVTCSTYTSFITLIQIARQCLAN
jgi:hypothetical protein